MGTRLQTVLAADRQKVAAEVAGTPFIAYLLRQIEKTCTRKKILFTGYLTLPAVQDLFLTWSWIFPLKTLGTEAR